MKGKGIVTATPLTLNQQHPPCQGKRGDRKRALGKNGRTGRPSTTAADPPYGVIGYFIVFSLPAQEHRSNFVHRFTKTGAKMVG
jgi:hypothetical protein